MDLVTALSAAGLGFVFFYLLALVRAGIRAGLPGKISRSLVLKTVRGALEIADNSPASLETQIGMIASKGGTTEAGLRVLRGGRFEKTVTKAILAAVKRAQEIKKE